MTKPLVGFYNFANAPKHSKNSGLDQQYRLFPTTCLMAEPAHMRNIRLRNLWCSLFSALLLLQTVILILTLILSRIFLKLDSIDCVNLYRLLASVRSSDKTETPYRSLHLPRFYFCNFFIRLIYIEFIKFPNTNGV